MSKPDLNLPDDDAGFSQSHLDGQTERGKVSFATRLRAGLLETLRAAADAEGTTIQEIVNTALEAELQKREEAREDPFEVYPPHEVKEE